MTNFTLMLATILGLSTQPPIPVNKPEQTIPKCVVDTVWNEARGEPLLGQLAIVHVINNRVKHKYYGDSSCEVVKKPWQFAYSYIPVSTKGYSQFRTALVDHFTTNTKLNQRAKTLVGNSKYFISEKNLDTYPDWYYKRQVKVKIHDHTFLN